MLFNIAGGQNDSVFGKSQEPIVMFLQEEEQAYLKTTQIQNIFAMRKTDKFAEKFSYMTAKPDFEAVGEGGAYPRGTSIVGYEKVLTPLEWKNSFEVTQTMIEDAEIFSVPGEASNFMQAYARTREKFAATILNYGNGTSTTFGKTTVDTTTADNVALFSTAHPSKTGGTSNQTNYFNAAFSYDNLLAVERYMQKFTDDDGNLLNIQPDTIIIPNEARIVDAVFNAVLTSSGKPGTGNNSANVHADRWNVITWNQLNNPAAATSDIWFVMDSKRCMIDGLIWLDRIPLSVTSWVDHNNDNNIWNGRARFGMGANNWRCIAGCYPGIGGTTL